MNLSVHFSVGTSRSLRSTSECPTRWRKTLLARLWDDKLGYLINFNGAKEDTHYYMGSLLAPSFGLLPAKQARTLMETASKVLVARDIGVRTVFPG